MDNSYILILICLLSSFCIAYDIHEPIKIVGIHATTDDPYIIEGFDIRSNTANCIEVIDSEHVVIRGNYLHHCNWTRKDPYEKKIGFAVLIDNSSHITVEDNLLEDNKQGITALRSEEIDVTSNEISRTVLCNSLTLERCTGGEISGNEMYYNGKPEWFWVPGHRIMAINLIRSADFDIHENTIVGSSSDGMLIIGMIYGGSLTSEQRDWKGITENIRIYNNVLLDNMEIGIAIARAKNIEVFNNTVRAGCFTPTGSIVLDFDVQDSEFYNNRILPCSTPSPMSAGMSKNNAIHDNIFYSIDPLEVDIDFLHVDRGDAGNDIKADWAGIKYYESVNNIEQNNTRKVIGGKLAEEIKAKLDLAQREDTFSQKGWFACEIKEGNIDKDCAEQEKAKGFQGVPSDYIPFSSLMADFDEFVIERKEESKDIPPVEPVDEKKEEKKHDEPMDDSEHIGEVPEDQDSIIDELIESWEATLIGIFILVSILTFIAVRRLKR